MDIILFRSVPFTVGLATGLLSYTATFGLLFSAPGLLETTYGLSHGQRDLR